VAFQDRLSLVPLAAITVCFHLAWITLNEILGRPRRRGPAHLFRLRGRVAPRHVPESEYPVGAVLLFALEALFGDGSSGPTRALSRYRRSCCSGWWHVPYGDHGRPGDALVFAAERIAIITAAARLALAG
jgi:hypothetical protein